MRAQGQIDGDWTLTYRDGRRETGWQVDVRSARSATHGWSSWRCERERQRLYLPLAADAVGADALRRLRVSLRAAG